MSAQAGEARNVKQPVVAPDPARHLELPVVASVPSRLATARSAPRRKPRIAANVVSLGLPASATSPPATSVKPARRLRVGAGNGRSGVTAAVAAATADDEGGTRATRRASATPERTQSAIAVEARVR